MATSLVAAREALDKANQAVLDRDAFAEKGKYSDAHTQSGVINTNRQAALESIVGVAWAYIPVSESISSQARQTALSLPAVARDENKTSAENRFDAFLRHGRNASGDISGLLAALEQASTNTTTPGANNSALKDFSEFLVVCRDAGVSDPKVIIGLINGNEADINAIRPQLLGMLTTNTDRAREAARDAMPSVTPVKHDNSAACEAFPDGRPSYFGVTKTNCPTPGAGEGR